MPTDYRHTDDHLTLVRAPFALWRTRQSRAPKQTNTQTYTRMDGRYQVHYLPRFAVDKNGNINNDPEALLSNG